MKPELLAQKLTDHIEADKAKFVQVDVTLANIYKVVEKIKDNELEHLKSSLEECRGDIKFIKNDLTWIKKIGYFLTATAIGQLLYVIDQLIPVIFNN